MNPDARHATSRTLRIGLSARLLHPDIDRTFLPTKSLHYVEECVAHWVMSANVLALMIPAISAATPHGPDKIAIHDYVELFDGLVLQGGADVAPESYGEVALKPEWAGDKIRDAYELELVHAFVAAGKPILGVCRGMQIINVAFGGTLYQDIPTQVENAANHRCEVAYENKFHGVEIVAGTKLAQLLGATQNAATGVINTIHHQAVKKLGNNLRVEAYAEDGKIIEAIRGTTESYVFGMQWHPEFMCPQTAHLLNCRPILDDFLAAVRTKLQQ